MGAGPAIKVPVQLVTGERWQGDGGDTCLGAQEGWSREMPELHPHKLAQALLGQRVGAGG